MALGEPHHVILGPDGKGNVVAVDDRTFATVATVKVAGTVSAIGVDSARRTVYIGTTQGITAVDETTKNITVTTGRFGSVSDLAVNPRRHSVYVVHGETIYTVTQSPLG